MHERHKNAQLLALSTKGQCLEDLLIARVELRLQRLRRRLRLALALGCGLRQRFCLSLAFALALLGGILLLTVQTSCLHCCFMYSDVF